MTSFSGTSVTCGALIFQTFFERIRGFQIDEVQKRYSLSSVCLHATHLYYIMKWTLEGAGRCYQRKPQKAGLCHFYNSTWKHKQSA